MGQPLPILVLSTQTTSRDVICGLMFGASWYMTKPFDLENLIAALAWLDRGPAAT